MAIVKDRFGIRDTSKLPNVRFEDTSDPTPEEVCKAANAILKRIRSMDSKPSRMTQSAPYPVELADLIERATFKPGWRFVLADVDRDDKTCHGLTLIIYVTSPDSDGERGEICVSHWFPVPAATYDRRTWLHWLFERCQDAERHESMEFFKIDGERPFPPHHRRGRNPYLLHVPTTDEDVHRVPNQDRM